MTSSPQKSSASNRVSAGPASDAKALAVAALLTFVSGMLLLIGSIMAGVFGFLLGFVGIIFGLLRWKQHYETFLPRDISTKALVALTVVAALAFGLAVLMT